MRLIACSLLLALLPGCGGSNCAGDGDCVGTVSDAGSATDTTGPASTTGDSTGTTGEPGTGTATTSTSTGTTAEPTGTTGEPGTTGGTTGGVEGEPSSYGPACAPDDGPATEFKIGVAQRECPADFPEDAPIFRIVLFTGPPPLAPGEYKLDGGNGFAYYDDGTGVPLTGMTGTLTITGTTADGVFGTYDVGLEGNLQLSGEFDAIFCNADVLCG